jgi:hypothetical protein
MADGSSASIVKSGAFDTGNVDETTSVEWVRAALTARDNISQLGGSQNVPLIASTVTSFSGNVTAANNAEALLTAASVMGLDNTGGVLFRAVEARPYSNLSGVNPATLVGLECHSIVWGSDSNGAPTVLRPVESRSFGNIVGAQWSNLIGLLTGSVPLLNDVQGSNILGIQSGLQEVFSGSSVVAGALEVRQNGFWGARLSRRFAGKHATEGGNLTAQAAYVSTTPTILLALNAAGKRAIVRSLYIAIDSATTNPVRVVIKIDSANRLSAGGTSVTPQNTNSGGGGSSLTYTENATATAEAGGTKRLYEFLIASGKGASITIGFNDEVFINATGSYLVYVFDDAGASGPSIIWNSAHEEE